MFNTELQVVGTSVSEVEEGSEQTHIEIGFVEGSQILLPIQDPQNPGQPLTIQFVNGLYRFSIDKKAGLDFAEKLKAELEKLPDPPEQSDLVIVGDVGAANQIAEQATKFSKNLRKGK